MMLKNHLEWKKDFFFGVSQSQSSFFFVLKDWNQASPKTNTDAEMKYGLKGSTQWRDVAILPVPGATARTGVMQHMNALKAVIMLKTICDLISNLKFYCP